MGAKMSSAAKRGGAAVVAALLAALLLKIMRRSHAKAASLEDGPKNTVKSQTRRKLELGKLQAELTPLKVSALKRRALAAGVGQEALEEVDDAAVRARPGRLSALGVSHSKSDFIWRFCMGALGA
jgi:hypothetical protein